MPPNLYCVNELCEAEATSIYTRPEDGRVVALCATCASAFAMGQGRPTVSVTSLDDWANDELWVIARDGAYWRAYYAEWEEDPELATLFTATDRYPLPAGEHAGGQWITLHQALGEEEDEIHYVIQKTQEFAGERPLFWSHDAGAFVRLANADRYDDNDVDHIALPHGGEWETLVNAMVLEYAYDYVQQFAGPYAPPNTETPLAAMLDPD